MERCKACRHFEAAVDAYWAGLPPGFGHCSKWHIGYTGVEHLKPNEVQVEGDEGWGAVMGPEFGCVLWEPLDIVSPPK